jgi:putative membrane protein
MPIPRTNKKSMCLSVAAMLLAATAFGQTQTDKTFVQTAMEVNLAEIQVGQLAAQKGATDGVKRFGQRLVSDHTRLEDEMKPIAAKIGVTPPAELAPDDQALLTKLQGESGAAFDMTFVNAMVSGHKQGVQLYKNEETNGQDAAVRVSATKGEPVIAAHLRIAERLAGTIGKS